MVDLVPKFLKTFIGEVVVQFIGCGSDRYFFYHILNGLRIEYSCYESEYIVCNGIQF